MKINLLVEGGSMQPGPALSQKIGPLGVNMGQIIQQINQATGDFKGMKVPVEVDINPNTQEISIEVFSPPVSELVKKELNLEKGSGEQKKVQVGNASVEQIISISKTKLPNLISKDLKAAVKEVVGSCVSLGVLIESKSAKDFMEELPEEFKNEKFGPLSPSTVLGEPDPMVAAFEMGDELNLSIKEEAINSAVHTGVMLLWDLLETEGDDDRSLDLGNVAVRDLGMGIPDIGTSVCKDEDGQVVDGNDFLCFPFLYEQLN